MYNFKEMNQGYWKSSKKSLLLLGVVLISYSPLLQALCINKEAPLKAGPSLKSHTTEIAKKYTPVKQVSRKKGWVEIEDIFGYRHFIASQHLSKDIRCKTIRTRSFRIRKGPGTGYARIRHHKLKKWTPVKVIGTKNQWRKIAWAQNKWGWLHKKFLR